MALSVQTQIPQTTVSTGNGGIPWNDANAASGAGIYSFSDAYLSSYSIASNVITVGTVINNFSPGANVGIDGMLNGTFLNGANLTVTQANANAFTAGFTYANTAFTVDQGNITPLNNGNFTSVNVLSPPYDVPDGQIVIWSYAQSTTASGTELQLRCSALFDGLLQASAVTSLPTAELVLNGACSLTTFPRIQPNVTWSNFAYGGALGNVYHLYPVVYVAAGKQELVNEFTNFSGGVGNTQEFSQQQPVGMYSGQFVGQDFGTDPTVLADAYINYELSKSDSGGGDPDYAFITGVAFAIYTDAGNAEPQELAATNFNFDLPSNAVVVGIGAEFQSGTTLGNCSLTGQLTSNGALVGTTKTLSIGDWPTSYIMGGGDKWGFAWDAANINGNGIGITLSPNIANTAFVQLNELEMIVYYTTGNVTTSQSRTWISL